MNAVRSGAPARASKVRTAAEAIQAIAAGATVVVTGSGGGVNEPDLLLTALEERFLATGQPADLTLYHPNGMGDGQGAAQSTSPIPASSAASTGATGAGRRG